MKLLTTIFRTPGIDISGKTVRRTAVRAIIRRGAELLMVHSSVNGDYKFPGGGLEPGESHAQALAREIWEECGIPDAQVGAPFGNVIEYGRAVEAEFEVFKMTSHYYFCQVGDNSGPQRLDPYEHDLGFHPVWMALEEAIQTNRAILRAAHRPAPRWTRRETFVLELLKNQTG